LVVVAHAGSPSREGGPDRGLVLSRLRRGRGRGLDPVQQLQREIPARLCGFLVGAFDVDHRVPVLDPKMGGLRWRRRRWRATSARAPGWRRWPIRPFVHSVGTAGRRRRRSFHSGGRSRWRRRWRLGPRAAGQHRKREARYQQGFHFRSPVFASKDALAPGSDRQAGNGFSRGVAKESGAPSLAGLPKKAVPEAAAARAVPGCRSGHRRGKSRRHGRSRVRSGPGP
jgi:hypothetical protein